MWGLNDHHMFSSASVCESVLCAKAQYAEHTLL